MITKTKKQETVELLVGEVQNAASYYFLNYQGLPVVKQNILRTKLKEKNATMRVAKNTLMKIAFDKAENVEFPFEKLEGMTSLVLGAAEDPLAPAKVIKDFIGKDATPSFKGAVVEGQFFDDKQLATLAAMPTKPEIIASIVGSLHAPISGIVGSINAVIRDLASIIEEVAKKNAGAAE